MGVLTPAFPAPFASNLKSLRFYQTGALTANFVDRKWAFERPDPATPSVAEQGWSYSIRITVTGGDLEFSFDGTNVHGKVLSGQSCVYEKRHEGGIAVRGTGTFYVEAW